jgi:hypothetical protein
VIFWCHSAFKPQQELGLATLVSAFWNAWKFARLGWLETRAALPLMAPLFLECPRYQFTQARLRSKHQSLRLPGEQFPSHEDQS